MSELEGMDTLVIDTAFISSNFIEWLDYLKNSAYQRGLLKHPNDLKIILTTDREDRLSPVARFPAHCRSGDKAVRHAPSPLFVIGSHAHQLHGLQFRQYRMGGDGGQRPYVA